MTPDLIVVSDLHLGGGRDATTGRFHHLEAFFHDEDLEEFCGWLVDEAATHGRGVRLILNGDTFDLLRVEPERGAPADAVVAVRAILAGHPGVVRGWAHLLAAGHEVIVLPGNHDLELQDDAVQAEVRAALAAALAARGVDVGALARLRFEPWFHHEPGRIWIEHGSQYDPEGAFRFLLRGRCGSADADRDLPLGNFFQRHLYNAFGRIAFVVPSSEANFAYLRWLALHEPRALARVLARHLPFALRLLGRIAGKARGDAASLADAHERGLAALAVSSGLGDRLRGIDALKTVGDLRDGAWRSIRRVARGIVTTVLLGALALACWSVGQHAIEGLPLGLAPKTVLSLGLGLAMLLIGGAGALFFLLRTPAPRKMPLAAAAAKLATITAVPLVAFGHSHEEDVAVLPDAARYFNTGTWITIFLDGNAPRAPVQYTFLHVTGATAELRYYVPGPARSRPVVLVDR